LPLHCSVAFVVSPPIAHVLPPVHVQVCVLVSQLHDPAGVHIKTCGVLLLLPQPAATTTFTTTKKSVCVCLMDRR
jgi:hypothetical protein